MKENGVEGWEREGMGLRRRGVRKEGRKEEFCRPTFKELPPAGGKMRTCGHADR